MSRPTPNTTLGGFLPNQVKINSIGIGINDETLNNLNLDTTQYMVVGGQDNGVYSMIVDSEGLIVNSSIVNRESYNTEYALFVDGNIFVTGKVDTSDGTLSNVAGGGGGYACNYWLPVKNDGSGSTNIYYDGKINIANEAQSRNNAYRVNIIDNANKNILHSQLAIQNQVGSVARMGILGYSNLSPTIINSSRGAIEFHVNRGYDYFSNVYHKTTIIDGQPSYIATDLPNYTNTSNSPHLVINADGTVGIKVAPNTPLSYRIRTTDEVNHNYITPTTITNTPVDLQVAGTTYSCNLLIYDYESRSVQNIDDLYVRSIGVTFAASQIIPGSFAYGDYTFPTSLSINGPIEPGCNLTVYGRAHITDLLYADKAFLTSNLVIDNSLIVNGTSYFENDVTMNNNLQIYENLVVWGGIYADSNSIKTIVPAGENSNAVVDIQFVNYIANGWSNIYMQGAGFITPGVVGIGINNLYDQTPSQLNVITRDSNIYGLSLYDKTNANVTKALFIGHQRSNIINGQTDASVIFSTPSSTSRYFKYVNQTYPQNMYFYPGKYDKSLVTPNMVSDNAPPAFSIYETGQVAVNSFQPNLLAQLYVEGNIAFSSNLYNYNPQSEAFDRIGLFKYGTTVNSITDQGISYTDNTAPHVGINRAAHVDYGLAVQGGIYADRYYAFGTHRGVFWLDSTEAGSDTNPTTTNGMYAISKVGIGVNEPEYLIDIRGNNDNINNSYGTYMRMNCSTMEGMSNTGIRFDGYTQPWFMNVEKVSPNITRYAVGCSPDINNFVDTYSILTPAYWNSNYSNVTRITSNIPPPNISYATPIITWEYIDIGSQNVVYTSNIENIYNITFVSNITSNITSNINNISGFPTILYGITYNYSDDTILDTSLNVITSYNDDTPLAPTLSNITYTTNYIYTSNITNTERIYNYLNTSNYIYSSNNNGLLIQHDMFGGVYGHQMVVGGNASLLNKTYQNPNPNPYATLTVNGDTSIIGDLNVSGRITANNTVKPVPSERSNLPTIENDDLFIGANNIYLNAKNKLFINYTSDFLEYPIEQQSKSVLNVYQDIINSSTPAPIAHFVGKGTNAYIEILSQAIYSTASDNDGILRIGLITGDSQKQIIGFQDGGGNTYMSFKKLGNTQRAMGINTISPDAQLHIFNNADSMNQNMFRLTYDNGSSDDTPNYTPNIMFEKSINNALTKKQWIIEGPVYGSELYNQLSFKYVDITTDEYNVQTINTNTILSMTSNGCIGLNTTTPKYLLDIVTSNVNTNHGIRLWNKINTDIGQLIFQSGEAQDIGGDMYADYIMYSCNNDFFLRQRNNLTSPLPLFHFNSNTNLGIRSYAPTHRYNVEIGGKLNVTDSIYVNDKLIFEASNVTGFVVNGVPNVYLRPDVTYPDYRGGVVINGNFPTSNLFHIFNDDAGTANMTVYDSVLDRTEVYYRNFVSGVYNVYQLYTAGNEFGVAYHEMETRDTNLPTSGWSNAFYVGMVAGTDYKEYDMTINGNLTLQSDVRGTPNISFGTNGVIGGNNTTNSLYIVPTGGANVGIGTTIATSPITMLGNAVIGNGLVGSDTGITGGPFFKQASWDTVGSVHTIAYPMYCVGDNSTGTINIQVSNKSSNPASTKLGNMQISFIKSYTNDVSVLEISSHKNMNLTALSVSNNVNDIVIHTDSDCSISWTSIGSY